MLDAASTELGARTGAPRTPPSMQKRFARAVLHFGADKTGSSSIQSFLDSAREPLLRAHGIAYAPGVHHGRLGSFLSAAPVSYILNYEDGLRDASTIGAADEAYVAALEHSLTSLGGAQTLVLSYEGFLDLDAPGLERLQAWCARLADCVEVHLYVRPPLSYARSAISQRARMGRPGWSEGDPPVRRYRERLAPIVAAFGKRSVHVRPFTPEDLAEGDVVVDFCRLLGIEGDGLKRFGGSPPRLNESLTDSAVVFAEGLRDHLALAGYRFPSGEFARRFGGVLAGIAGRPIRLDACQAAAVLSEHAAHGEYLRREFNIEFHEDVSSHVGVEPHPEGERILAASLGRVFAETFVARQRVDCAAGAVVCERPPEELAAGTTVALPVALHNRSSQEWLALGPHPVRLSYHWLTRDRRVHHWDGLRTDLPLAHLPAGASIAMTARVETPRERGHFLLQLVPLQEGCSWLDAKGFTAAEYVVTIV